MKFSSLIGLSVLALAISGSSCAWAETIIRGKDSDQRLSAPVLGGIVVGNPADTVMKPIDRPRYETNSRDNLPIYCYAVIDQFATAMESGLIAATLPWMPNNGNTTEVASATAMEYGLIRLLFPMAFAVSF